MREQIQKELSRINNQLLNEELPHETHGISLIALCPNNAAEVISKSETIVRILIQLDDKWPRASDWHFILPLWLLEQFSDGKIDYRADDYFDELSVEEQEFRDAKAPWSLLDWTESVHPSRRNWFWWSVKQLDSDFTYVTLETSSPDTSWYPFAWLLRASGATSVSKALGPI